jgi:probable rRNA maturation factor
MILLDPDLGSDLAPLPRPNGKRLAELPIRRGANGAPRSGAGTPKSNWRRAPLPWAERLQTLATLNIFLREAQQAVRLRGQVSVLLTTDAAIRKLNREFRGKNQATDVLSFPALDLSQVSKSRTGAPASEMVGDLAISVDTARKQAAEQGHALTCELKILMLHGLLHLAGYDHETDSGEMARRERALRAKFGLPMGLIARASTMRPAHPKGRPTAGGRPAGPARKPAAARHRSPKP